MNKKSAPENPAVAPLTTEQLKEIRRRRLEGAITPQGTGGFDRQTRYAYDVSATRPDWDFWRNMPNAEPWQACALSLDLDPDSLRSHDEATGDFHFVMRKFPSQGAWKAFGKRTRLLEANRPRQYAVALPEFALWALSLSPPWDLPRELVALATAPTYQGNDEAAEHHEEAHNNDDSTTTASRKDTDEQLAKLFDPVGKSQLEKMFPAGGKWDVWTGKAKANGLYKAREGRAKFNPYRAARWWLDKQDPPGWDLARCSRVLSNNLPARSLDSKHQLTGELD